MMWSENSDFQQLPLFLLKKKAVVNVKNNDQRSFGYSILSAKYYQVGERNKRIIRRMLYDRLFKVEHLNNIPYPVSIADMEKYEESLNMSINIITFSDDAGRVLTPLYLSNKKSDKSSIDLLYWRGHFAWIRNRSRLLSHLSKRKRCLHYCVRCFSHFISESRLNSHASVCFKSKNSASINPTSHNSEFRNKGSTLSNNSSNNTTPSNHIPIGFPMTTSIFSTNESTSMIGLHQNFVAPNDSTNRGIERPTKESTLDNRIKSTVGSEEQ